MKKTFLMFLILMMGFSMIPTSAGACSCTWKGPFLTVAKDAPLVVLGKVLRHHPGTAPAMDVLVLETLAGGLLDSGLVVQMGDGMHCRPTMDVFPPETEWILALNGSGSKPGAGLAISHCGEYWLRVENGEVVGSIDGDQSQVKRMPLSEFKNKFLYQRFDEKFTGRIISGERFRRPFGGRFEFLLEPTPLGWEIEIKELGRDENLARLTPPLHSAPNPREIEGWQFSKNPSDCISRPYEAETGPENPRKFIFSPEVGKQIDGPNAGRSVTPEEIQNIERFGKGTLTIKSFQLEPGKDGCPKIQWLDFSVQLEGGY
jgi:hypothetical protein